MKSWLSIVDHVLRPARPDLERCLREREPHLAARRIVAEQRARALADCERRIEDMRAGVFAANDGVVTASMTALEKEWRLLARGDRDGGVMDLWARIAPKAWMDRKMWRDAAPETRVDLAIALAADVKGVEAAEMAMADFRTALASWGVAVAPIVRYRVSADDTEVLSTILDSVRSAPPRDPEVEAAMLARFADRPLLARDLAYAASVDIPSLRALYRTGYALAAIDPSGITLEVAPLDP